MGYLSDSGVDAFRGREPGAGGRLDVPQLGEVIARQVQDTASFSPALYDTFAIITRAGARLSPGVRELLTELEMHMRVTADGFDRSR